MCRQDSCCWLLTKCTKCRSREASLTHREGSAVEEEMETSWEMRRDSMVSPGLGALRYCGHHGGQIDTRQTVAQVDTSPRTTLLQQCVMQYLWNNCGCELKILCKVVAVQFHAY